MSTAWSLPETARLMCVQFCARPAGCGVGDVWVRSSGCERPEVMTHRLQKKQSPHLVTLHGLHKCGLPQSKQVSARGLLQIYCRGQGLQRDAQASSISPLLNRTDSQVITSRARFSQHQLNIPCLQCASHAGCLLFLGAPPHCLACMG